MFVLRLLLLGCISVTSIPALASDTTFSHASSSATLIELYSSEGCSSCPPAEEWLGKWKDSPELWKTIFPVAFHVDYWDGLGWPDRFARPAYTERQRHYAAKLGQDSVYTPEFVVNGQEWRGFFAGSSDLSAIQTTGRLILKVAAQARSFTADYEPASAAIPSSYTLHVCLLGAGIASNVQRGENAGLQLRHDFIVLDFHSDILPATTTGHFHIGPVALSTGADIPQAVVAWISTPETEVAQIVGGSLADPSP